MFHLFNFKSDFVRVYPCSDIVTAEMLVSGQLRIIFSRDNSHCRDCITLFCPVSTASIEHLPRTQNGQREQTQQFES